ncbi:hypothetical protein Droror1_Dr00016453 [Drosera rotundifolia]
MGLKLCNVFHWAFSNSVYLLTSLRNQDILRINFIHLVFRNWLYWFGHFLSRVCSKTNTSTPWKKTRAYGNDPYLFSIHQYNCGRKQVHSQDNKQSKQHIQDAQNDICDVALSSIV